MNKTHLISIIGILIIISFFAFATYNIITPEKTIINQQISSGKEVTIKMTMSEGNYQFEPKEVTLGDKVKIAADMSKIGGCYSTVVIPELNVKKSLSKSDNVMEFIATKSGALEFTCGMGMAGGRLIVKNLDGTTPKITEPIKKQQHSCGMNNL